MCYGLELVSTQPEPSLLPLPSSPLLPMNRFTVCPLSQFSHLRPRLTEVPGAGPLLGAVIAAGFYVMLKKLHYEDVYGDQDKSADEQSLRDAQSDLERMIRGFNPQTQGSRMPWATQARLRDSQDLLRLYRLSGLDGYKQMNNQ